MTTNLIQDMLDFHTEMSKHDERQAVASKPAQPAVSIRELRVSLIEEEEQELVTAMYAAPECFVSDMAEIADGIADSIVVLIGTAIAYGIPLQKVWDEVHRTNMNKLTEEVEVTLAEGERGTKRIPIEVRKRDDGKILKPEGWTPPQIEKIITEAM